MQTIGENEPPEKVQKYEKILKNPNVQVGSLKTLRNRTLVVPEIQPLSKTLTGNSSIVQRATKKPKGKGFSKGAYGEETIVILTKSRKTNYIDDAIPDLVDENGVSAHFPKPTRKKKGSTSILGKKSADAKRMALKR